MKRIFQITPLILIAAVFTLLSAYTLSGIQILAPQPETKLIFWSFIFLSTTALIYVIQGIKSRGMGMLFKIVTHFFLILFISELLFAFLMLAGDAYRGILVLVNLFGQGSASLTSRSPFWIGFALVVIAIATLIILYGIVKGKYAYRVINHQLYFSDLPDSFDGFKIAQISDVHAGSLKNKKAVKKGVDLINSQNADLFVFTGDLVNNEATEVEPWISLFSTINAPYGQYSILGNHDYGDYVKWPSETHKMNNLDRLKTYHKEMGFKLLLDEHIKLEKNEDRLILAGVENWGLGFGQRGDLNKALEGTAANDFKILLSHDPSHWEVEVKDHPSSIHLTLSGHTHGMQFGIEAFGFKWSPVKYRYPHWAGIKETNQKFININRGFGFLGFSGRVGIWPEITIIELKKK